MGKFIGWLGGIVATVIAGWLVWYITLPKPTEPDSASFEGMVYDQASNAPVSRATVMFDIRGVPNSGPYHDVTDENGSYKLDLSGLGKSSTVAVSVEANGFAKSAPYPFSGVGDNRRDFALAPFRAVSAVAGGAAIHLLPHPKYIPKLAVSKIKIK